MSCYPLVNYSCKHKNFTVTSVVQITASDFKANLLVVDDHPDNLRTLSAILSKQGYKVRKAISGEIALHTIGVQLPDIILLDIKMPGIDGYTVCSILKKSDHTRHIPIIFLSALDTISDKVKAFKIGCADYITKPFQTEEVLIRVEHQLTILRQRQKLNQQHQNLQQEINERKQIESKLKFLLKTINLIKQAVNFDQALDAVLSELRQVHNWDYGEAWMTNKEQTKLYLSKASYDSSDQLLISFAQASKEYTFSYGIGVQGRAWEAQKSEWIEDIELIEKDMFLRWELAQNAQLRSILTVPITLEKQALIVMCFFKRSPIPYNLELLELVNAVAIELSGFIQNKQTEEALKQANKELTKLANIDALTQVANRRCFNENLSNEWLRMRREQAYLALIMCDIDYFKLYNDFYGHQAGDECLYQVAQAISQTCKRSTDLVARYGGEELVILLPNTDLEGAVYVAKQIQNQISNMAIPHQCSLVNTCITMSMGVTSMIPNNDNSPVSIIAAADKALYTAKAQGRNTYCIYSPV
ncbi:diguanylate cyclase [Anabaena sp. UHCC 0253]|uniref:diguanylate cyclase domain-containing protein n=1 Tax=Anabaena sp. UHCC 0253 TaxID=2590019 RepID=UPI001444E27A|nr:diguanylate cyclase [Anabaena sp. UHCC 0253]MTJ52913.1 diguanylate cyclase [Anabaena sp. UHCC 0253]